MTRIRPVVPVRLARELRDAAAIDGVSLRELVGALLTTFGSSCTSDEDEPGPRERLDIEVPDFLAVWAQAHDPLWVSRRLSAAMAGRTAPPAIGTSA